VLKILFSKKEVFLCAFSGITLPSIIAEMDVVFKFKASVKTAIIAFNSFKPTVSLIEIDKLQLYR
tara:strand:+ start:818 stop:1012 length:195 start_codon:yes stop_codon:yes gene_type:complete